MNLKFLFLLLLITTNNIYSQTRKLNQYKTDRIIEIITLFKEKNINEISNKINYPLNREYPVPPVKNREEFIERFDHIFDKIIIDKIANSKIEQWSEMGWRGIMLDNGIVWMANSDGIITSVNYQSNFEKRQRTKLIDKDKQYLNASLKTFKNPIYKIKTERYLIRIDELTDNLYRYASWKINENESSKPDIILYNGEWEFEGSGGNHVINFINGNYTYKVYRNIIGNEKSPDIILIVEKDNEVILTQEGMLIIE